MAGRDLEAWYLGEGPRVLRYLTVLCRDPVLAEELTQETFVQALTSLGSYRGGSERAYLFGIARRVLAGHNRREGRRRSAEVRAAPSPPVEAPPFPHGEAWLPELPPEDALLLVQRAAWGRQFSDIAKDLGRTENWARVRYFRLLTRIRADLGKGADDDDA